jgi:hypothetical protein
MYFGNVSGVVREQVIGVGGRKVSSHMGTAEEPARPKESTAKAVRSVLQRRLLGNGSQRFRLDRGEPLHRRKSELQTFAG